LSVHVFSDVSRQPWQAMKYSAGREGVRRSHYRRPGERRDPSPQMFVDAETRQAIVAKPRSVAMGPGLRRDDERVGRTISTAAQQRSRGMLRPSA
jgi:hypothetical protein